MSPSRRAMSCRSARSEILADPPVIGFDAPGVVGFGLWD